MISKIVRFFVGSCDYRISENTDLAADILTGSGANCGKIRYDGNEILFSLQYSDCTAVESIFSVYGIHAERIGARGFLYLLERYKKRIGIPIGIVIFFLTLWLSEQFIWHINVVGNENVTEREILSRLENLGCGVGTYIPSIDFDEMHQQFLLDSDDIAWIAVNVRGTHATVEVREMLSHDIAPDDSVPYNLVAAEDGVIEYMEILRGSRVAREEDLVRKGELLASGLEQMKHGLRLVHARGKVMAEVKRTLNIEVPLETTVTTATGREFSEKYLNFFGISMKLFANTGNLSEKCDKIERDKKLCFLGTVEVPITVHETVYLEYNDVPVTLTEEEARAEAYRRLREETEAATEGGELVSRQVNAGMRDGSYVIECELTVVTDIAKEVPIYTTGEN